MKVNVKVQKVGNSGLDKFLKNLSEANKSHVEIGFFDSQGIHPTSKLKYTDLMKVHEYGRMIYRKDGSSFRIPPRPVMRLGKQIMIRNLHKTAPVKRAFRDWKKNLDQTNNIEPLLEKLGQYGVRSVRGVFGDKSLLAHNAKITRKLKNGDLPLIHRGDLRKNVAYRTSATNVVRTKSK